MNAIDRCIYDIERVGSYHRHRYDHERMVYGPQPALSQPAFDVIFHVYRPSGTSLDRIQEIAAETAATLYFA